MAKKQLLEMMHFFTLLFFFFFTAFGSFGGRKEERGKPEIGAMN